MGEECAACSCTDARAVSAVTIAAGPPDGAEASEEFVEGPPPQLPPLAEGLMDEDGVFHGPDGVVPDLTLGEFVLLHLREHADAHLTAQVDATSGEAWSFRTLLTESVQVATALAEDGLGPGDTIAFFSKNYHELYSAVLGCVLAGITCATMVPTHGSGELKHQLELCRPKAIFVEPELLLRTQQALEGFFDEIKIITLHPVKSAPENVTSYQELSEKGLAADPDTFTPAEIEDRNTHVAFILYSSGTTGLPKGVQIPNHGLLINVANLTGLPVVERGGEVSLLMLSPISWISGVIVLLKTAEMGVRRVTMATPTPRALLTSIQKYKINLWPTAPSVLLGLMKHPAIRMFNFSSISVIVSGGGPLPADLQMEVSKKLGCAVVQGYGTTESGVVIGTTPERNKPGSLGLPEALVSCRVVDLDTEEVVREPGRVGELRIRSPCRMVGYIGNPEATAEAFDDEGWYKCGDLVSFDSDGFIFYVDRLKEMIKYKSHQVAPTEVETVLLSHPGVKDACVMGVPNLLDGEHPMAFIVKNKKHVEAKELQDFVADRMSEPKHLRGGIIFLDSIPRTVTGKTMRSQLKLMLATHLGTEE